MRQSQTTESVSRPGVLEYSILHALKKRTPVNTDSLLSFHFYCRMRSDNELHPSDVLVGGSAPVWHWGLRLHHIDRLHPLFDAAMISKLHQEIGNLSLVSSVSVTRTFPVSTEPIRAQDGGV